MLRRRQRGARASSRRHSFARHRSSREENIDGGGAAHGASADGGMAASEAASCARLITVDALAQKKHLQFQASSASALMTLRPSSSRLVTQAKIVAHHRDADGAAIMSSVI